MSSSYRVPTWPQRSIDDSPPPLYVGHKQAARMINVSPRSLTTYRDRGEIPHKRLGRRVLYPYAALARLAEDKAITPPVKRPEAVEGGDA